MARRNKQNRQQIEKNQGIKIEAQKDWSLESKHRKNKTN